MPELDILYMTRVQKERFFNGRTYPPEETANVLTREKDGAGQAHHGGAAPPAPCERDRWTWTTTTRAPLYFEQVQNGVYVRMALIMTLLGLGRPQSTEGELIC